MNKLPYAAVAAQGVRPKQNAPSPASVCLYFNNDYKKSMCQALQTQTASFTSIRRWSSSEVTAWPHKRCHTLLSHGRDLKHERERNKILACVSMVLSIFLRKLSSYSSPPDSLEESSFRMRICATQHCGVKQILQGCLDFLVITMYHRIGLIHKGGKLSKVQHRQSAPIHTPTKIVCRSYHSLKP